MKNQHLTVQTKAWSGARRCWSGSARRRGCGKYLARHADSVVIVLFVPSRASNDFFYGFPVVFLSVLAACSRCFGYLVLSATQDLHHVLVVALMFTADRPWRRCVGKQTRAAPELELRDVVWSDESFSQLREQPNHQSTRICWGQPYLAIVLAHVFLAIFSACTALPPKPSVERRVRFSAHFLSTLLLVENMVIFSRVPLSFSVSLPRIWLSRTSKIDALDDDETPLRFTASQTDTTRGVMVSGIMGTCDTAPSLHFVEPGLKLNAEEWIKVMDEYTVPNCTALMEPGRKFSLILDNAPSHASRIACEHYSTVLHGTVEFQPPCSPDLSSLGFFLWNELRVQLVQHPAPANPAELLALLTRVYHRTWAGSREMFEKIGNAWVRRLKACVAARGGFFEKRRHCRPHRTTQRHSAKKHFIRHVI